MKNTQKAMKTTSKHEKNGRYAKNIPKRPGDLQEKNENRRKYQTPIWKRQIQQKTIETHMLLRNQ